MINKYSRLYINSLACLLLVLIVFSKQTSFAQQIPVNGETNIRLNQVGFYPEVAKTAIILNSKANVFYIENTDKKTVFTGNLKNSVKPDFAGNNTLIADFTAF